MIIIMIYLLELCFGIAVSGAGMELDLILKGGVDGQRWLYLDSSF